jgi:hypothetical protein
MIEELWKKWVANPEEIAESEKVIWLELQQIISDVLTELKGNNKIETNFTSSELVHFKKMMNTRNNIADNFGKIADTTDTWEKVNDFIDAIKKFNFTEVDYIYIIVELSVMNIIMDSETFKTLLLFHLKDIRSHKSTEFTPAMKNFAPISYNRLEPYINNKFRNSLAHGTWAIEDNQIVLFEDAKLVPFERLELLDFLLKVRRQNILISCLSSVISDKKEKGFFACHEGDCNEC